MTSMSVHEVKAHLSRVLKAVEMSGETLVICRRGVPIADITPHRQRSRTEPHPVLSKIKLKYDPTEDIETDAWPEDAR